MKRKSTAYRIVQAFILVLIVMLLPVTTWAQETKLTTKVPSSHILHLDIEGKGTVTVNGTKYSVSKDISLQRHSEPLVQIQAARGYSVKSVTYNQENITHLFNSGKWIMPTVETDVTLSVVFVRDSGNPPTGDIANLYLLFVKYILSIIRKCLP